LRSELQSKGHTFTTETDTEVLAAAYAQWSTAAVQHLVGMFAFVLYDPHTRKVFAARDRAGEKPLYYWRDGAAHWFASELKALLHDPRMPRRLHYAALDHYLAYGYVPGEDVLIEGVRKVPAAHAVEFDIAAGTMRMWRYWSLPAPGRGNVKDAERELESRLETAVRRQLVADVPVGIMLSGGVDSSVITALATRVAGPPRTFTVSFRGAGEYDEAPYARLIAKQFNTEHHELVAEPASIDVLPALAQQFDEPIADASIVPNFLVAKAIREHAKVALGGNGGDELFGGYRTYQWVLRQQQLRAALPGPVRTLVAQLADSLPPGFRARNYLRGLDTDTARAVANVNLYFDVRMRRRLVPQLADGAWTAPEDRKAALWAGQSMVQQLTRTDFDTYLAESILLKEDRASMLASLEVRSPFLVPAVIELAFGSLPDELRVTTRARKVLLARLARRLLPPQFDSARKQGFSVPVDRWLKDDWGRFFRSVLLSDSATLFDRATVARLLNTRAPGVVHGNRLFNLTMLELWLRAFSISI
jgi:asparagine synthase (glutamine-hydrolysing)